MQWSWRRWYYQRRCGNYTVAVLLVLVVAVVLPSVAQDTAIVDEGLWLFKY